ncbi:MAG: protein-disulfide reductase DsbD [Gammaproteobacteria bacterium]|nr:protein-disulfide reductase DsbD [Gammaproteobacteria bacterium]MCP5137995.1 protein-disulfide reductase DsbD [Gammaproteobacteria bacterium]
MRLILLSLALLLPGAASAVAEDDLLSPDEAFSVTWRAGEGDQVIAEWRIADGYYLYHEKIRFQTEQPGVTLGKPEIPEGKTKQDEFFGDVEIHRGQLRVVVPVTRTAEAGNTLTIEARSQGCADVGVCYPPHSQVGTVQLATPAPAAIVNPEPANALEALAGLGQELGASSGTDEEFLDVDQAFKPFAEVAEDGRIQVSFEIADKYYLYLDRLKFELVDGNGLSLGEPAFSKSETKDDQFFGRIQVYHHEADVRIPVVGEGGGERSLKVGYQGCAEAGLCYPPETREFVLDLKPSSVEVAPSSGVAKPAVASRKAAPQSEQDRLASMLAEGSFWFTVLTFFGFGLLLAFTPCVFPMIPILSSIIVGQGAGLSTRKAFILSLTYVLAMAITYTVAGILAGIFGAQFNLQTAFQNPWILGTFAMIFVALSLSMFGFYEIQLPASLQGRLSQISNQQQGGSLIGVAIMGLLSALIVGPCVAPPLAGALIYISQTGDAVLGGMALFALSMGMGVPLIVIGTSAGKLLPRAGSWMDAVKGVFGVLLLGVAVWMLERILPPAMTMTLAGLLLISSGVYMGALEPLHARHAHLPEAGSPSGWRKLWKALGLALLIFGALELVGAAAGGKDWMQPLRGVGVDGGGVASAAHAEARFTRIKSSDDLDAALAAADGRPVMLDFYADWCVACKELEKYTFGQPEVQAQFADMVLLQADVTDNDAVDKALMQRFGIIGPPSILIFDGDGQELRDWRIVGFMEAPEFVAQLRGALE